MKYNTCVFKLINEFLVIIIFVTYSLDFHIINISTNLKYVLNKILILKSIVVIFIIKYYEDSGVNLDVMWRTMWQRACPADSIAPLCRHLRSTDTTSDTQRSVSVTDSGFVTSLLLSFTHSWKINLSQPVNSMEILAT